MSLFRRAVAAGGDKTALRFQRDGAWVDISWNQYGADADNASRALMALGVKQFGAVAILGFNAPQWFSAMMGAVGCGAKAAGIYTTNGPAACAHIAGHCEASVVFTEDGLQTAKFLASGEYRNLPHLTTIVQWGGALPASPGAAQAAPDGGTPLPPPPRVTKKEAPAQQRQRNSCVACVLGYLEILTTRPVLS